MQSTAAKVRDNYEYSYSRDYRGVRREQPSPQLQVKEGRKPKSGVSPLRLLCCCTLMVALISLAIYNNIVMVELGDQLNGTKERLQELQSQSVVLQSKLESQTSAETVENYASTQLGMGLVDKYQVTYVTMDGEGAIFRTDKAPDKSPAQVLLRGFDSLLEYMKLK
jgi:cell division protein FtsL